MSDAVFRVLRLPEGLGGPESVVREWGHPDPATARTRAVSHAQRLARLDSPLSACPTYIVRGSDDVLEASYPPELRRVP